jgi:ubiquinone/menaquinone biosynthesis C-methylase UbiE
MHGRSNHAGNSRDDPVAMPQMQLTVDQAYALWAETYDTVTNPLLALEERYLGPMLPSLHHKTVLDLGCGTGRLLGLLASSPTARYIGVDMSSAMLARARGKLRNPGHLLQADCLRLPLRSGVADVTICSFVLGYVNGRDLAAEIARVSKDSADLYLSEFHPDALSLGWKRSFRCDDQVIELPTHPSSLQDVASAFRMHGFLLARGAEPGFDEPERKMFVANKKDHVYQASRGTPAIFIFHLRRE